MRGPSRPDPYQIVPRSKTSPSDSLYVRAYAWTYPPDNDSFPSVSRRTRSPLMKNNSSSDRDLDHDHDHDAEDIDAQLRGTIRQDGVRALRMRRPLLMHLNADTSWLLSLPVPVLGRGEGGVGEGVGDGNGDGGKSLVNGSGSGSGSGSGVRREKEYFHILIDPWLKGSQSDVAQFFSQQWHAQESAVQTIAEVEEIIGVIEDLASAGLTSSFPPPGPPLKASIDAVVVSHEFTDHMHKETLLEVPNSVAVFAASKAASIIRSWRHFEVVVNLPTNLNGRSRDWRVTSVDPLPSWLGISRLGVDKVDLLYYHSAVMIAFSGGRGDEGGEDDEAEAVIYTPHGITPEDLKPVAKAEPPIRTLALLHGLHNVRLGPQLNLGAHNGLKVQRLTKAKYWVSTHDEVKRGGGLVSWFLTRQVYSVKEALEKEIQKRGEVEDSLTNVHFRELGNGEGLLLE